MSDDHDTGVYGLPGAGDTNADVVAQNQEAAASELPEGMPAIPSDALPATGEDSPRTEPQMFVGQGVRDALAAQGVTVEEDDMTQEEANEHMRRTVFDQVAASELTDTNPEQQLLAAIEGFRKANEARWSRFLTGQTNSQSEALRCLKEAVFHLDGHIGQMKHFN
jgi:hypothetical protein